MCLFTNERYKSYQTGFSFGRLGHAPGVGLGGTVGGWGRGSIFFSVFNQSWCLSYLHERHMQQHSFLGPPSPGALGRGQRSNIIKSQLLSQFQIFLNQTLCVSQMKDIKHITQDLYYVPWVMLKGLGLWGAAGVKNLIF